MVLEYWFGRWSSLHWFFWTIHSISIHIYKHIIYGTETNIWYIVFETKILLLYCLNKSTTSIQNWIPVFESTRSVQPFSTFISIMKNDWLSVNILQIINTLFHINYISFSNYSPLTLFSNSLWQNERTWGNSVIFVPFESSQMLIARNDFPEMMLHIIIIIICYLFIIA